MCFRMFKLTITLHQCNRYKFQHGICTLVPGEELNPRFLPTLVGRNLGLMQKIPAAKYMAQDSFWIHLNVCWLIILALSCNVGAPALPSTP